MSSKRFCKYAIITPLLVYIFVKTRYTRTGVIAVHFLPESQLSGIF